MTLKKSADYNPRCTWCNKEYKKSNAVYPKGLFNFVGGEMGISKGFCSSKCLSQYNKSK